MVAHRTVLRLLILSMVALVVFCGTVSGKKRQKLLKKTKKNKCPLKCKTCADLSTMKMCSSRCPVLVERCLWKEEDEEEDLVYTGIADLEHGRSMRARVSGRSSRSSSSSRRRGCRMSSDAPPPSPTPTCQPPSAEFVVLVIFGAFFVLCCIPTFIFPLLATGYPGIQWYMLASCCAQCFCGYGDFLHPYFEHPLAKQLREERERERAKRKLQLSQWLNNNGLEEYTAKFGELVEAKVEELVENDEGKGGCDTLEVLSLVKEEDLKPFMKLGHLRKTMGLIKAMPKPVKVLKFEIE